MNHNYYFICLLLFQLSVGCISFSVQTLVRHDSMKTQLFAKEKKKKRATRNTIGNRTQSASGFGGAAVSPCPCGSEKGYMKCCGLLHSNADAYGKATAEEVVRARYSAYAKRHVCV